MPLCSSLLFVAYAMRASVQAGRAWPQYCFHLPLSLARRLVLLVTLCVVLGVIRGGEAQGAIDGLPPSCPPKKLHHRFTLPPNLLARGVTYGVRRELHPMPSRVISRCLRALAFQLTASSLPSLRPPRPFTMTLSQLAGLLCVTFSLSPRAVVPPRLPRPRWPPQRGGANRRRHARGEHHRRPWCGTKIAPNASCPHPHTNSPAPALGTRHPTTSPHALCLCSAQGLPTSRNGRTRRSEGTATERPGTLGRGALLSLTALPVPADTCIDHTALIGSPRPRALSHAPAGRFLLALP